MPSLSSFLFFCCIATFMCQSQPSDVDSCNQYSYIPDHYVTSGKPRKSSSSSGCFTNIPVSFESCRQLLSASNSCDLLSFSEKRCSLFDSSLSETKILRKQDALVMRKKLAMSEECRNNDGQYIPAVKKFRQCIHSTKSSSTPTQHLPILGIVISVTEEWADQHRTGVTTLQSNFQCYASAHNYEFVSALSLANIHSF